MTLSFDEFMAKSEFCLRNAWVYHPGFSQLYVRVSLRTFFQDDHINYRYRCIDVANVEAQIPGNGAFKKFLQHTAEKYPEYSIYVESVLSDRFSQGLLRLGFKKRRYVEHCYYLPRGKPIDVDV